VLDVDGGHGGELARQRGIVGVALVTGARSGIGAEIAYACRRRLEVVVGAPRASSRTWAAGSAAGGRLDVHDPASVERLSPRGLVDRSWQTQASTSRRRRAGDRPGGMAQRLDVNVGVHHAAAR
jgi:NAD(P)-dependent dehydrogenase (short-subunit alcohol dehydrogenase family)